MPPRSHRPVGRDFPTDARTNRLLMIAIVVLAAVLALSNLGEKELWWDETVSATFAYRP